MGLQFRAALMSVWEDVKKAFAEGKFKTYARWGGILNVFGIIISLFIFHGCVTHIIVGVAASVLVGILELPFCCTCLVCCNKIAEHLKFFEVYFARGLLYIGMGIAMVALVAVDSCWVVPFWGLVLAATGVCYCIGHFRGEKYDAKDAQASGLGIDADQVKLKAATHAMGIV